MQEHKTHLEAKMPALDWSVAVERADGDGDLLVEIIDLFREDCPRLLAGIRDGVTNADAAAVRLHAHSLKGSLGYLGAGPAVVAAQYLESVAASGDLSNVDAALQNLEEAIDGVIAALADQPMACAR